MFKAVLFREPLKYAVNMLPHAGPKVIRMSRIKRPVAAISNDVNCELIIEHGYYFTLVPDFRRDEREKIFGLT